ncbi:MAG: tetratricopeptide repeat protein [Chloroherpetonaceae bacterium]
MSSALFPDASEAIRSVMARAQDALSNKKYSDAADLALQALQDSERLNQVSLQTSARLLLAEALIKEQKFSDALPHLHHVLDFSELADKRDEVRHALSLLGRIAYYKKNYPLALEYLQNVLTMCESCADEFSYTAHHFIGIIYARTLDSQKAIESSRSALRCAEALNSPHKVAQTLVSLGNAFNSQGNLLEAFSHFRRAESICQAHGFADTEAVVLQNLATLFTGIGDLEQSLLIHHRLIEYYERIADQRMLGYECINLAGAYFTSNKMELATHFCERAINILSVINEEDICALARLRLAEIHLKENQLDLAVSLSRDVVTLYEERGTKEHLADAYFALGESLHKSGDTERALVYLKKGVDFTRSVEKFSLYALFCISLAEIFLQKEDYDTALSYFEDSRAICEQQNINSLLPKVYLGLSQMHDKRGDFRNAYDFYRKYHDCSQAVFNLDVEKIAQRLSIQYDLRQKEQEAKKEREKAEMLYRVNQELHEANRLKNEFLSIAAHDLKNPLQSIIGFSEIIQEAYTSLDEAKSHAQVISRSASHMARLIKSLLETAAISSSALTFEFEKVNLNDLLQKVIADFTPMLQAKSQIMVFNGLPNALALVDIDKMKEVFSNLISNAIKYSPPNKTITVQIAPSAQSGLLISIKDEGQGLSESDKAKLFGQFQRLSSRPTGGEGSTGLGLWITKAFVEKHNGNIWAESEGKGRGTTFFVELPAAT